MPKALHQHIVNIGLEDPSNIYQSDGLPRGSYTVKLFVDLVYKKLRS
jgi:hypothetical protein